MESRKNFIDVLRGIAIILMILGHNIQFGSGKEYLEQQLYFENIIFKIIYSFHMPLLMIISGYLFFFSIKKYSIKQLISQRVQTVFVPILSWSIIPWGFYMVKRIFNRTFEVSDIMQYIRITVYNLWYLWAIIVCFIAIVIINKLFNDSFIAYFLLSVCLFFIPSRYNLHLYAYMIPYFICGFLINKYKIIELYSNRNNKIVGWIFFIIGSVLYFLLFLNFDVDSYIYTSKITILVNNPTKQVVIDIHRWTIGFLGIFIVVTIINSIKWLQNEGKITKCFSLLGKHSLGIYAVDCLINSYVLPRITTNINFSVLMCIIETLIVTLVCLLISLMLHQFKVTRICFLGGR